MLWKAAHVVYLPELILGKIGFLLPPGVNAPPLCSKWTKSHVTVLLLY